jgi:hypothetical protein
MRRWEVTIIDSHTAAEGTPHRRCFTVAGAKKAKAKLDLSLAASNYPGLVCVVNDRRVTRRVRRLNRIAYP